MRAAKTRMRSAFGQGRILASAGALAALAASIAAFSGDVALAQNAECARLQQAIAARRGSSGAQAAVERQRAELARTRAYARSLGCGNRKFLMFGSDPPPQCGEVNAQISRMQANLADLQARAGGGAGDLVARYNAECVHAPSAGPSNVFEALFGGIARLANGGPDPSRRWTPDSKTTAISRRPSGPIGRERARPGACRLLCGMRAHLRRQLLPRFLFRRRKPGGQPGGRLQGLVPQRRHGPLFVPVRRHDRRGRLADRRALRKFAQRRQIRENLRSELLLPAQGAELGGSACRRGSALWPREARHSGDAGEVGGDGPADHRSQGQAGYGFEGQARRAERVSGRWARRRACLRAGARTPGAPSSDTATAPVLDANGADTKLSAAAATVSRETSGIAGDDLQNAKSFSVNQGRMVEVDRARRGQARGADSRASALARPISGRRAASSGPASRPVKARRNG